MIIIVEGADRTGKDSLIDAIKSKQIENPFFELKSTRLHGLDNYSENFRQYSIKYYMQLFDLLRFMLKENPDINLILNRAHLSEYVYSVLYRGYSGEFVFNLENDFVQNIYRHTFDVPVYLICLKDSVSILQRREDGLSQFPNAVRNIEAEQYLFTKAFNKSMIGLKHMIDIDGRDKEYVVHEAFEFLGWNYD